MGAIEDTLDEFKKGSKTEKVVIVGAVVGVGAIVLYLHYRSTSNAASPATSTTGQTTSTAQGLQTFPYGSQPVLDSSGNPVAVIGPPPQTPTTTPPAGTTTPPSGTTTSHPSSSKGPLIPSGQYKGPNYSNLKKGTTYNYQGVNYVLNTGPGGKLYGTSGGKQVLLYGPPSMYPPKQGGGPFGTRVLGSHGRRVAPTKEGHSYVAKVYARRTGA
jgi:hypothetical protein